MSIVWTCLLMSFVRDGVDGVGSWLVGVFGSVAVVAVM